VSTAPHNFVVFEAIVTQATSGSPFEAQAAPESFSGSLPAFPRKSAFESCQSYSSYNK